MESGVQADTKCVGELKRKARQEKGKWEGKGERNKAKTFSEAKGVGEKPPEDNSLIAGASEDTGERLG